MNLWKSTGGGVPEFLADEKTVTAADSAHGSNEDDTKACLGFLVYLFTGVILPFILLHQELLLSSFEIGRINPFNE